MRRALLVAALTGASAPGLAEAHQGGLSYGDFTVRGDGIEASLRVSAAEVAPAGAGPHTALAALAAIRVARGTTPCAFVPGDARPEPPDGFRASGAFRCAPSDAPLRLDLGGLLDRLSWGHTHLAKVTAGLGAEEYVVRAGRTSFTVAAPAPWLSQTARFVHLGLEHIFTGADHIAFVLGLLLLGGSLRQVVGVVTSFTLAHSVTLALASLTWVRLPAAVVEPLIAASIVCIAVENLLELRRAPGRHNDRRPILAFAFGLVHGFGFAGALTELHRSAAGLATALLSFNAGVELGQAAIIAAAFPLLAALRRWPAGAPILLRTASVAIGMAGAAWLVARLPWPRFA
jgi:HupE / UreJ protein